MSNNKSKKIIKTKLADKDGKMPSEKSMAKMQVGDCIFPFVYDGTTYNECYKGKKGDWCATKVNKDGKMKRFAYCDYKTNKSNKKPTNKHNNKPTNKPSNKPTKKKKNYQKKKKQQCKYFFFRYEKIRITNDKKSKTKNMGITKSQGIYKLV